MSLFRAIPICVKLAICFLVQIRVSQSWSYPESTVNLWTDLCATGSKQSPINFDSAKIGDATVHSNIEYLNYFRSNSRDPKAKMHKLQFKNLLGVLENDGVTVKWTIGHNVAKPFKKCMRSKGRRCPSIRNGPFRDVNNPQHAKNPEVYFLWQLHFHWGSTGDNTMGSEHTVDGKAYPLEMHMKHINKKYINQNGSVDEAGALNDPDNHGFAVIGMLFEVNATRFNDSKLELSPLNKIGINIDDVSNRTVERMKRDVEAEEEEDDDGHLEEWETITRTITKLVQKKSHAIYKREADLTSGGPSAFEKMNLNPGKFISKATKKGGSPKAFATYFSYHGSVTTPGCEEVVHWVVFDRPLTILQHQVDGFKALYEGNYRAAASCTQCTTHSTCAGASCNHDAIRLIHDDYRTFATAKNTGENATMTT